MNTRPQGSGQSPDRNDEIAAEIRHDDPYANLAGHGLTEAVSDLFTQIINRDPGLVPGRVVRVDGISTSVHASARDYRAVSLLAVFTRPAGADADSESDIELAQPTVGDWVLLRPGEEGEPDAIELVLPRTSLLVRRRVMRGKEQGDEQLLAANIDTVFIVQSVTYFNASRLEREIALVWGSGSVPVVVLTKSDLVEVESALEVAQRAESVARGVEIFSVSGITGSGTGSLRPYTATGQTVVLIGASGVGKSTLVNQLMGEDVMDTGEIREADDRGRHTTNTRQLLPLPGGGVLIDSPGIRTIGLTAGSEEAIAKTFSEIEEYLGKCRFRNCAHAGEPGCAITEAIDDGRLLRSRLDSYRRLLRELQFEQTKHVSGSKTDRQIMMRIVAKSSRHKARLERRSEPD